MIFKRKPRPPIRIYNPKPDITTFELASIVAYGFSFWGGGTARSIEHHNESLFQHLPDNAKRHFDKKERDK
ncbi:hypothetical protein LCGC14_2624010 [marine sediment metagenome]|uniref:Uncharacterized protein n=1 Tax=marine sediment metagenome TaxID=412755 RepID=A0A0F9APV0_9ZZZZ